jgi:hypothetical protein
VKHSLGLRVHRHYRGKIERIVQAIACIGLGDQAGSGFTEPVRGNGLAVSAAEVPNDRLVLAAKFFGNV